MKTPDLSSPFRMAIPFGLLEDTFTITPEPEAPRNQLEVKQFFAYRCRLPLTAICLLSGLGLALLSSPRIIPGSVLNDRLIGAAYALLFLGVLLRIWSIAYIHSRKTIAVVTTGPYSLCRNPLYLGTLMIVTAHLMIVQSITLAAFFLPIVLLYIWGVVPAEEAVLRSRHGAIYDAYCTRVSRWLPMFSPQAFARNPFSWSPAVRRELECAGWWLLTALATHLVCSYRMAAWWQHPFMWP